MDICWCRWQPPPPPLLPFSEYRFVFSQLFGGVAAGAGFSDISLALTSGAGFAWECARKAGSRRPAPGQNLRFHKVPGRACALDGWRSPHPLQAPPGFCSPPPTGPGLPPATGTWGVPPRESVEPSWPGPSWAARAIWVQRMRACRL